MLYDFLHDNGRIHSGSGWISGVSDWLNRARAGMLSRLTDRSLDREGEYINEINRLNDKLWLLNKEKMNAEQERDLLKAGKGLKP